MNLESYPSTKTAWNHVGKNHHHGINIPLFGIHTEKSCGVGEFFDLLPLIDWCNKLGMDVVQLLPLNESGRDPSPYNALSSCALHPIYLSLHALPYLEGMDQEIASLRSFNKTKRMHYLLVYEEKLKFLKTYLNSAKEHLKKEASYDAFVTKHEWLAPYALFRVLKELYSHIHWKHWPEEERSPSHSQKRKLYEKHADSMEFYFLVQYLCFSQLRKVKAYATSKNVFLKGDVPILVSPDSADVWHTPSFFDFNHVAGSPPNKFDKEGQYWGFPLYNWKAMHENHYEWWKKRLLTAEELYHIYRIDHIIGFFRLWAIPPDQKPEKGHFLPGDSALMKATGRSILSIITSFTDMLPIGEDLGQVPPFVSECLKEYGIPGTKIFRWQRDWGKGESYIPYEEYDPISMSSVSTHDLDTVPLWWEKKPEEARAYAKFKGWNYQEKIPLEYQFEILRDSHKSGSLFHINLLQEYLSLVPELTWEDPEDERINYPGTIQPRNWSYKYKMPLEKLISHPELNRVMKKILEV